MERIIRIDGFTNKPKRDKTGTFPCFECLIDNVQTFVGVFEKDVEEALKKHIYEWVKVVAPKRSNGYTNITHFIALAKKEEVPNFSEQAKSTDSERVGDYETSEKNYGNKDELTPKQLGIKTDSFTKVIHELIDNRIVYNKYEFGAANDRHTIKYKDVEDFKKQYTEIMVARRIIDAELNPKQE